MSAIEAMRKFSGKFVDVNSCQSDLISLSKLISMLISKLISMLMSVIYMSMLIMLIFLDGAVWLSYFQLLTAVTLAGVRAFKRLT